MNRPPSIVRFEQCYLGNLVLGFVVLAITWNSRLALFQQNPATAQLSQNAVYASLFGGLLVGAVISLVLWYFAARQGSVVAKWIIVVFFALSILGMFYSFSTGQSARGLAGVLQIVGYVLYAVAVWLLFKPDSRAWFGEDDDRAPLA